MTENTSDPAAVAVEGTTNADVNTETTETQAVEAQQEKTLGEKIQAGELTAAPDKTAQPAPATPPAYQPNYKYKAALQEKELDEFWRPLIKDQESEKKVKQIFSKVDAFDFVSEKKEALEKNYNSLLGDFESQNQLVSRFNKAVEAQDLSSAFRTAGITKEAVFKWAQQQIAIMELPPEQRQQFEEAQAAREQKFGLEEQVSRLQGQYENQAVQNRTIQLDMALSRPQVASFAEKWDEQTGPGAFREFVVNEAKRIFHETKQDITPDQAVNQVMQRFGKLLNVGNATAPAPQAQVQQQAPQSAKPVIPNVTGKAASPIKKRLTLDDIKKLAKEM